MFRFSVPPRLAPSLPDFARAREAFGYVVAVFGPFAAWALRVLALIDGVGGRNVRKMVGRAEAQARHACIVAAQDWRERRPFGPVIPHRRSRRAAAWGPSTGPQSLPPGANMRIVQVARPKGSGRRGATGARRAVTGALLAARMARLEALLLLDEAALVRLVARVARALDRAEALRRPGAARRAAPGTTCRTGDVLGRGPGSDLRSVRDDNPRAGRRRVRDGPRIRVL